MNGLQRVAAAFSGEQPDRIPVMLHNFMMAARETGQDFSAWRNDPERIARGFAQAVETYGYDGVVLDLDTATLAGAVGVPVEQPRDEPALCRGARLTDLATVDDLPPVDVATDPRVQTWLEAARLLVDHFGGEIFIRGNCDQAPFSLASMMRGAAEWMMDLTDPDNHPRTVKLLDYCAEAALQFVRLMAGTGVHMVSNGDSPAGPSVISPQMYRTFARPWEKRLVDEAHRQGLPYLLHICGRAEPIIDDMLEIGADALEFDHLTDETVALTKMRGRAAFVGNLDPSGVLCLGSADLVERKTRELTQLFAGTPGFVLGAGCAIPASTPPENIHAMVRGAQGA